MNAWEIYSYGNLDWIYGVMNAVAAITQTGDFISLIRFVALVGVMIALLGSLFNPQGLNLIGGWGWFFSFTFIYMMMFVPKVNVILVDKTDPNPTGIPVQNIPLGLGFLAHATSSIGTGLTDIMEVAFQAIPPGGLTGPMARYPAEFNYQKNGLMFAARAVQATREANINNPDFKSNITNFFLSCTLKEIDFGEKDANTIINTNDLWAAMATENQAFLVTYIDVSVNPKRQDQISCKEAYTKLTADYVTEVDRAKVQIGYWINSFRVSPQNAVADTAGIKTLVDTQLNALLGVSGITNAASQAAGLIRQNTLINVLADVGSLSAARTGDPSNWTVALAQAQTTAQFNSTYISLSKVVAQALPIFRNTIQAILYAIFPIVLLIMLAAHGKGLAMVLKSYLITFIWIELWPPLYAVLNYISQLVYIRSLESAAQTGDGVNAGLSIATAGKIYENTVSDLAVVSYMVVLVPTIATAIIKGGEVAFAAVGGMSALEGYGKGAAASAAVGNVSLGVVAQNQYNDRFSVRTADEKMAAGILQRSARQGGTNETPHLTAAFAPGGPDGQMTLRQTADTISKYGRDGREVFRQVIQGARIETGDGNWRGNLAGQGGGHAPNAQGVSMQSSQTVRGVFEHANPGGIVKLGPNGEVLALSMHQSNIPIDSNFSQGVANNLQQAASKHHRNAVALREQQSNVHKNNTNDIMRFTQERAIKEGYREGSKYEGSGDHAKVWSVRDAIADRAVASTGYGKDNQIIQDFMKQGFDSWRMGGSFLGGLNIPMLRAGITGALEQGGMNSVTARQVADQKITALQQVAKEAENTSGAQDAQTYMQRWAKDEAWAKEQLQGWTGNTGLESSIQRERALGLESSKEGQLAKQYDETLSKLHSSGFTTSQGFKEFLVGKLNGEAEANKFLHMLRTSPAEARVFFQQRLAHEMADAPAMGLSEEQKKLFLAAMNDRPDQPLNFDAIPKRPGVITQEERDAALALYNAQQRINNGQPLPGDIQDPRVAAAQNQNGVSPYSGLPAAANDLRYTVDLQTGAIQTYVDQQAQTQAQARKALAQSHADQVFYGRANEFFPERSTRTKDFHLDENQKPAAAEYLLKGLADNKYDMRGVASLLSRVPTDGYLTGSRRNEAENVMNIMKEKNPSLDKDGLEKLVKEERNVTDVLTNISGARPQLASAADAFKRLWDQNPDRAAEVFSKLTPPDPRWKQHLADELDPGHTKLGK